ncbi:hypothetical protein FQA39_LY09765 [Lamprigera yunnana]|nr:hypothetical protein FQA39_LY09765 [Lamprigera yunnana]
MKGIKEDMNEYDGVTKGKVCTVIDKTEITLDTKMEIDEVKTLEKPDSGKIRPISVKLTKASIKKEPKRIRSVREWEEARVKSLASKCKFESELSILMGDIFVVGIGDEKIMERLFEEDASNKSVTLQSVVLKIALAKESARNEQSLREANTKPLPGEPEPQVVIYVCFVTAISEVRCDHPSYQRSLDRSNDNSAKSSAIYRANPTFYLDMRK